MRAARQAIGVVVAPGPTHRRTYSPFVRGICGHAMCDARRRVGVDDGPRACVLRSPALVDWHLRRAPPFHAEGVWQPMTAEHRRISGAGLPSREGRVLCAATGPVLEAIDVSVRGRATWICTVARDDAWLRSAGLRVHVSAGAAPDAWLFGAVRRKGCSTPVVRSVVPVRHL